MLNRYSRTVIVTAIILISLCATGYSRFRDDAFGLWVQPTPGLWEQSIGVKEASGQAEGRSTNKPFAPLVATTITTTNDVVDGTITSITALNGAPGPDEFADYLPIIQSMQFF